LFRHRYFVRIDSPASFMSHLDRMRFYDRLLRRADLNVAYSEGFNPRPRISCPLALAVGHESDGEILEVDYEGFIRPQRAFRAMRPFFIKGMEFYGPEFMPSNVHTVVEAIRYRIRPRYEIESLDVQSVLDADELPITVMRKGRERSRDARPLIRELAYENGEIRALLAVTQKGALKVAELLKLLALDDAPEKYFARRYLVIKEENFV